MSAYKSSLLFRMVWLLLALRPKFCTTSVGFFFFFFFFFFLEEEEVEGGAGAPPPL